MGKKVRAVVRDEAKGHVWASKGASVAVADLADSDGMGRAIAGSEAVFVMLPPLFDPRLDFQKPNARSTVFPQRSGAQNRRRRNGSPSLVTEGRPSRQVRKLVEHHQPLTLAAMAEVIAAWPKEKLRPSGLA